MVSAWILVSAALASANWVGVKNSALEAGTSTAKSFSSHLSSVEMCPLMMGQIEQDFSEIMGAKAPAGTVVVDQFPGITVSATTHKGIPKLAMIFDSENPTGGDTDLASITEGNLVIISEDGDSSDPDDNANGGILTFEFDCKVEVEFIRVIDFEEGGQAITTHMDGSITTVPIPMSVDGEVQQVAIGGLPATKLVIKLIGSGAVSLLQLFNPMSTNNGDPMVTTFSGEKYQTKGTGVYLNTQWNEGKNKITSCVYNAVTTPRAYNFTKAISYTCQATTMIAHLSKKTLKTWKSQDEITTYNVYYFNRHGKILKDSGDFGEGGVAPGEYSVENRIYCPEDAAVELYCSAKRSKWHGARAAASNNLHAPMMNFRMHLRRDSNGEVADVSGGLSQSPKKENEALTGFIAGPNVAQKCSTGGQPYHNSLADDPCGPESWLLEGGKNIFNQLATHKSYAYIERCDPAM